MGDVSTLTSAVINAWGCVCIHSNVLHQLEAVGLCRLVQNDYYWVYFVFWRGIHYATLAIFSTVVGRHVFLLNKPKLHTKQLNVLISDGLCAVIDWTLSFRTWARFKDVKVLLIVQIIYKSVIFRLWMISKFSKWSLSLHISQISFPSSLSFLQVKQSRDVLGMGAPALSYSFPFSNKADNHLFPNHISMPVMRGVSQPLEYDP